MKTLFIHPADKKLQSYISEVVQLKGFHIEQEFIRTAKVLLETQQEMTPEHKAED
jgi:hypothetical protein